MDGMLLGLPLQCTAEKSWLCRKKTEIPVYSFEKHARVETVNTVYSPHVLVLEGIFALHDQRVLEMLDLKVMHARFSRQAGYT
jgi:uridine kinase